MDKSVRYIIKRNLKNTFSKFSFIFYYFCHTREPLNAAPRCSRPLTQVTVNLQASGSPCPTQDAIFTDKSEGMWTLWHKNKENYNVRVLNEELSEPTGRSRLSQLAKTTAAANCRPEELQSVTAGASDAAATNSKKKMD